MLSGAHDSTVALYLTDLLLDSKFCLAQCAILYPVSAWLVQAKGNGRSLWIFCRYALRPVALPAPRGQRS